MIMMGSIPNVTHSAHLVMVFQNERMEPKCFFQRCVEEREIIVGVVEMLK